MENRTVNCTKYCNAPGVGAQRFSIVHDVVSIPCQT